MTNPAFMREDLKSELYKIAVNRVRANQYGFGFLVEPDLKEYIEKGVDRMTNAEYISNTKRVEAKINTIILIDAMTANSRDRLTESLDYKSFVDIKNTICPLWPFC